MDGAGSASVAGLPVLASPAGGLVTEPGVLERLAASWLVEYRGHTRVAYLRDLAAWSVFCRERELDLLVASRAVVAAYADHLLEAGLGAATINRKLSALTGFYRRAVELGLVASNPAEFVRRPKVSQEGVTPGLDRDELRRVLAAARLADTRTLALVSLLALNALRVSEAVSANAQDLSSERGHRTLMLTQKGGGRIRVPLAAPTAQALDAYLAGRETGPLFLADAPAPDATVEDASQEDHRQASPERHTHHPANTHAAAQEALFRETNALPRPAASQQQPTESVDHHQADSVRRLSRFAARRIVQRTAKQALVKKRIGAHSLRVAAITGALDAGASFRDVQDFARHADPRTTRRYDRNRQNLDRNPTYQLTSWLAE